MDSDLASYDQSINVILFSRINCCNMRHVPTWQLLLWACSFFLLSLPSAALAKENTGAVQHAPPSTEKALRQRVAALANLLDGSNLDFDPSSVRLYFRCGTNKAPDCRAFALFITMYTGGNMGVQYLALFDPVDAPKAIEVVPKYNRKFYYLHAWQLRSFVPLEDGFFTFKGIRFSKNQVTLSGLTWGPKDPDCCPSKKITVTFKIKDGVLMPTNSEF